MTRDPKRSALLAALTGTLVACGGGSSPVLFVDGLEDSGVDFARDNGRSEDFFMAEYVVAGVILFDAEGDGDPDLYFPNATRIPEPPREPPSRNRFYVNDGTGRFTDATEASGLGDPRFSMGVCGGDYDNDGDVDLYVTNFVDPNALFRNEGGLRFSDVASEAGVEGTREQDSSAAWVDLDLDGFLDLYVCNYNDHSRENNRVCLAAKRDGSGPARRYCSVEAYPPVPDVLYRNRGDGTFEDVTEEAGIAGFPGRSLGVAAMDFDDDGDQDLLVACDRTQNLYFENLGGLRFRETGLQAGVGVSRGGKRRAGMGIDAGDLDGDGAFDVAITYFEKEHNGFYHNLGSSRFLGNEEAIGTAPASFDYIGWGVELFDADLDTDLDCIVVNGHVIDNAHLFREPVAGYGQPNLFYSNRGDGTFEFLGTRAGPPFEVENVSRGLAVADIDLDGDVDAVVANLFGPPEILRNESPREGRHWLQVDLEGRHSNRSAIGARVTAHLSGGIVLVREVHSGQSYASQSELRQHFGLGERTRVDRLEVRWPSGLRTVLEDVPADQVLLVVEPEE